MHRLSQKKKEAETLVRRKKRKKRRPYALNVDSGEMVLSLVEDDQHRGVSFCIASQRGLMVHSRGRVSEGGERPPVRIRMRPEWSRRRELSTIVMSVGQVDMGSRMFRR